MSRKRKSFILHHDSLNVLDDLTDEQAGLLFKAIKAYQVGGEINLDPLTTVAMSPFKNQFDRDNEKYEKLCEKNRLIAENRYNTKSTTGKSGNQPSPEATKSTDNDSKNKSDSKSDSDSKLNNNDCSEKQSRDKLLVDSFDYFWGVWKKCKKQIGKTDTSPKKTTYDKKWKVMFNTSYFKNNDVEQFKAEINKMSSFCIDAHNVQGFNRFQNMQLPKFLSEKQWRDNE